MVLAASERRWSCFEASRVDVAEQKANTRCFFDCGLCTPRTNIGFLGTPHLPPAPPSATQALGGDPETRGTLLRSTSVRIQRFCLRKKLLWKLNEGNSSLTVARLHNELRIFPLFPLASLTALMLRRKIARNPKLFSSLARQFSGSPAPFRASRADFAHFGHKLRFLGLTRKKFAAPGNSGAAAFAQYLVKPSQVVQRFQESFSTGLFSGL